MNLLEEVDKIKNEGYSEANAEAKLCQDIIISAISKSSLNRNVTIKGGVVMRSLSGEIRRATQDIDLDFIRYSISEERVFTNSTYKKQVERSRKNWLDMSVEEVLKKDLEFVQGI